MREIIKEDIENCIQKCDEYFKARMNLYRVLVQPEYLAYFSNPDQKFSTGYPSEYVGLAKDFRRNLHMLYDSGVGDSKLYIHLVEKYHRTDNSITVAYENIPVEVISRLSADEIISIYLGEMLHDRFGGAFESLFKNPFFIKSLYRLKDIMDKYDESLQYRQKFRL